MKSYKDDYPKVGVHIEPPPEPKRERYGLIPVRLVAGATSEFELEIWLHTANLISVSVLNYASQIELVYLRKTDTFYVKAEILATCKDGISDISINGWILNVLTASVKEIE